MQRLSDAFNRATRDPEIKKQLNGYGYEIEGTTPPVLTTHIHDEIRK
ncbi:hypothetical protein GSY71_14135 [Pusillimonas sp. TS35]|nr:hypothetical protein [Pusillimonas sp. TS35]